MPKYATIKKRKVEKKREKKENKRGCPIPDRIPGSLYCRPEKGTLLYQRIRVSIPGPDITTFAAVTTHAEHAMSTIPATGGILAKSDQNHFEKS